MNKILKKRQLSENVNEYVVDAPEVAKHARPGQFVILRVDSEGERVPFTIADADDVNGTITILVQTIGMTTYKLSLLNEGEFIHDFVGPLGNPTDLGEYENIVLVGGGIGSAVIYPQAKFRHINGLKCDVIVGARNKSLLVYEDEFRTNSDNLYIVTDDGSYGEKGFVTNKLEALITDGKKYDCVFAVGPVMMMKAVCDLTKKYGIKTIVSMNSTMVDGTGMCGCCRLSVGGETKYACVDGPEFDGHQVDFMESVNRGKFYKEYECECYKRELEKNGKI